MEASSTASFRSGNSEHRHSLQILPKATLIVDFISPLVLGKDFTCVSERLCGYSGLHLGQVGLHWSSIAAEGRSRPLKGVVRFRSRHKAGEKQQKLLGLVHFYGA